MEVLEGRVVPATFGVPWQDPAHLSLSFAPDGTTIAGHTSSLFQSLNAHESTSTWQREVLQAFQTWAVRANINIGLVPDGGQAFGATGPTQHDPRFGDIRVGAQPMTNEALSISVPNDPALSGTWGGDVLVNSNETFGNHALDLFAVMLHEAGHVFGIGDSNDPKSPMDSSYHDIRQLTAADITALQSLYGVRSPDSHEGSSNNDTMSRATQVPFPGSYTGATPLVEYGDITTNQDVDYYAVRPPSNYTGPITFLLQSSGISLLTTHLTVLDARGNILGQAQAASGLGDKVTVQLNRSSPNATYYIKVEGASHDVFGIGGYGLAVTFDAVNKVTPAALGNVLRGPYQTLGPNDINAIFLNPNGAFFDQDQKENDDAGSATQLTSSLGFAKNSHYETVASISNSTDVDFYRIQPPNTSNGQTLVLTATVRAVAPNGAAPQVTILDKDQHIVPAQIIANGNGVYSIQASNLKSGGNYYLRVSSNNATTGVGNYALTATFGGSTAQLTNFAGGSVGAATSQQSYHFYVAESQLFQFLLSAKAAAAPAGTTVNMTITDRNGKVVNSLIAPAGDTRSGPALFLSPGEYTLTFTLVTPAGAKVPTVAYTLSGEALSDPIGPVIEDPTLAPVYTSPTTPGMFLYPGGIITPISYWLALFANQPVSKPPLK